jgi:hypothetical protein
MFYNEKYHKEKVVETCLYNIIGYELPVSLMKNDGTYIHPINDIYVNDDDFNKCYEIAKERFMSYLSKV